MAEPKRVELIHHTFNDAFKAHSALVILDDLEGIVELTAGGEEMMS